MSNFAYQLCSYAYDATSAEKTKLALYTSDAVMRSHPELPVDKVRLMHGQAVVIDGRETNGPAFAAACMLLGIID